VTVSIRLGRRRTSTTPEHICWVLSTVDDDDIQAIFDAGGVPLSLYVEYKGSGRQRVERVQMWAQVLLIACGVSVTKWEKGVHETGLHWTAVTT